ncbi:hypothetical protein L9F63_002936 [Diploptera punctata]|uniref:Peptidoglycan-recognition protein n=1 Tax=Diploptera punctata TaxID=6984 RepID=A0AAD8ECQ3_DIPPU|nr:hypothetical protein L9F63_002936 [Diploptera punctata]
MISTILRAGYLRVIQSTRVLRSINMQFLLIAALTLLLPSRGNTQDDDECSWIINKSGWGGRPSKEVKYMNIPVRYVIIQHTATPRCNSASQCADRVANIQTYHMDTLNWHDIGISFLVGGDGNVYEGSGWHQVGAHTRGYNTKSIGVAFIGNFDDVLPPKAQLDAARHLLDCGVKTGRLSDDFKLIAQRQVSSTISPGLSLFREIQKWPEWVEIP